MNINEIINNNSKTEVITIVFDKVSIECNYGKELSNLNTYSRIIYLCGAYEEHISTESFEEFFYEETGDYIHETIEALSQIKASKNVKLLHKLLKLFPKKSVPKGIEERQSIMDNINDTKEWVKAQREFISSQDSLQNQIYEYIKNNADKII